MRPREGFLELLQLEAREGGSVAALLPLRGEIIRLGLALGAGRGRSRMSAFFLGPHLFRGDAHLDGLRRSRGRCRRRLLVRLRVRLLAHLLAHLSHLARATRAARRTRLRDGLLAASSRRMICAER